MSISGGQIIHSVHGFVIDRISTAGPGSLNIPEEKIYELGNYQTVATVRDIPDLSFDIESVDVSCELEALIVGKDATDPIASGTEFDFTNSIPMDVISPFKSRKGQFDIVKGIAVPYLTLERATYRFGVRQNATQQFSFKGDSIYYIPGSPYYQAFAHSGVGPYSFSNTGIKFTESGNDIYALCVVAVSTNGAYRRLFFGDDFTNTSGGFTLTSTGNTRTAALGGTITLRATYGSTTAASYPQSVHQGTSVKPAAVRGQDIDIYIGSGSGSYASTTFVRLPGVQNVEINRSVSLQNDEELGNAHFVTQDYDTADVTGSISMKPYDAAALFDAIYQVTGVNTSEVIGPKITTPVQLRVQVRDPGTGSNLKTWYIPDARFQVPGLQGRANSKLENTFNWTSDGGQLKIYAVAP